MFVGTNNMQAHFDNLRMNRLQLTLKQFEGFMSSKKKEKEYSDAAKDEGFLGNNDSESGESSYRFKTSKGKLMKSKINNY